MHYYDTILLEAFTRLTHLSYPKIFLTIIASGHPLPVPEGVVFFALGVIARHGPRTLEGVLLVSSLAVFVYDLVLYGLVYLGTEIAATFSKFVKTAWVDRYSEKKDKEILFLTFISHFVPGWRMANPIIAATLRIPPHKFIIYTILPALVYPTAYILAGFFLSRI